MQAPGVVPMHPAQGGQFDIFDGYVHHHLQLAGRSDPLFTDDAPALIHDPAAANPALSTASPSPHSSPPAPPARTSSTKPAPDPPSPKPATTPAHRRDTVTTQPSPEHPERGYLMPKPAPTGNDAAIR